MKKMALIIVTLILGFAGNVQAQIDREEFIEACLQQAGLTSFQAVCQAKTAKDAEALEQNGFDSEIYANFANATTVVSWYQGQEFYHDVKVAIKGLLFKKYLTLQCQLRPDGKIQVGGFTVDLENRIDNTIQAKVTCR